MNLTDKALRKFGLVVSVPFLLLGAYLAWKGRPAAPYFLAPGGFLVFFGLVYPAALGPVEKGWMWVAGKLSIVSTAIILTAAYFLLITPIGVVMRIMGRDELRMKRTRHDSYWIKVEENGSASRPYKPY